MGFMENLRRNVFGVFGTIILFIILILFLWGDASQGGANFAGGQGTAGIINDEEISFTEFTLRVEEAIDAAGTTNINRDSIEDVVWEQLVQETVLYQTAAKYGVAVSDEELASLMYVNPPQQLTPMFTDSNGTFMQETYNLLLQDIDGFMATNQVPESQSRQIKSAILAAQRQVRLQATVSRLFDLVGALYPRSPVMLRAAFDEAGATASGEFALLSANLISDDQVKVSDEEIKAYYDERLETYKRKPSKIAKYVMLRLGPSGKDSSAVGARFGRYAEAMQGASSREDSTEAFGEIAKRDGTRVLSGTSYKPLHELPQEIRDTLTKLRSGAIIGPIRVEGKNLFINVVDVRDSGALQVRASHILLNSPDENDSALSMANNIVAEARSGTDFAEMVSQYSQDPGSVQQGGDVGWVTEKSNFVQEFKDAALAGSKGEIIGPIKSEFGYHIIKITDRSDKSYKVRALNFDVTVSANTRQQLQRKANRVQERLEEGENFEAVAEELGLQVLESPPIINGNLQIAGSRRIANFAHEADLNDVSKVMKMADESYIVAQVSQINRGGPAPMEEVRDQIEAVLKTRKKVEMLKGRATSIHSAIAKAGNVNAALSVDSTIAVRPFTGITMSGSFPDVGNDPALAAAVFGMKPGSISNPIKGTNGYYVVRLDSLTRKGDAEWATEKESFISGLLPQKRQTIFTSWFDNILQNSRVSRNQN